MHFSLDNKLKPPYKGDTSATVVLVRATRCKRENYSNDERNQEEGSQEGREESTGQEESCQEEVT
jgi:hypothetical protein